MTSSTTHSTPRLITSKRHGAGLTTTRAPLRTARLVFYHVYIAFALGANATLLIPQSSAGLTGSNGLYTASWIVAHGLTLVFLLTMYRQNATNLVLALAFGGFIFASAIWSAAPGSSAVYGAMLAGNILVAHMMASDLLLPQILRVVGRTIVTLCIFGLVAYFVGYQQVYYFDVHDRTNLLGTTPMRGFFGHKIRAGLYATIGAIASMAIFHGWRRLVAISITGVFVVFTGSATGLILLLFSLACMPIIRFASHKGFKTTHFFVFFGSLLAVTTAVISIYWVEILGFLGRGATLTGRTILWEFGISAWLERPILGWGFNAYFKTPESTILNQLVGSFANYDVPHFHNSFIQTAVDLGIVGFTVLVAIIIYVMITAYALATRSDDAVGVAALLITATVILAGLTMFLFLNENHFASLLLFSLFFALRRWKTEQKSGPSGSDANRTSVISPRQRRSSRLRGVRAPRIW